MRTSQNYKQTTKNLEYIRKPTLQETLKSTHERNNNQENRTEKVDLSSVSSVSSETQDDMPTIKQDRCANNYIEPSAIPQTRKLGEENFEFKTQLGYTVRQNFENLINGIMFKLVNE